MDSGLAPIRMFSPEAASFGVDLLACMQRVVDRGWFVLGPEVRGFEQAFAAVAGAEHVVGVGNGTDALILALRALDVRPGQRVVTVANAGGYSTTALKALNAEPVYVDVEDQSLLMDPQALSRALADGSVVAVIVTHLYGRMAQMSALSALCREAGVPLIEDCAQAHGAVQAGRPAGAWGALACFSFYPTKNLGALGDGGAVVTSDDQLAGRLRALRQYGWGHKYEVELAGGCNSRLDELQAAVLVAKLPQLGVANERRRAVARQYQAGLAGLPLQCPPAAGLDDVVHLYAVRTPQRAALQAHLQRLGIDSEVHYPVPDHRQSVWADRPSPALPTTEAACGQVLSLPCHPGLDASQVQRVIDAVCGFFEAA